MTPGEIEKFIRDGWIIVDVPHIEVIRQYAVMLEQKVRELTGKDCSLTNLHKHLDNRAFEVLHLALAEYFWQREFSLHAGKAFLPLLKDLIGLDIMVQYMPYLRLARPGKEEDNIGFHKDTQYGQTPYELAVHVAFVDLDEHSALKVISGSHRMSEDVFSHKLKMETKVTKGSPEHILGKPYAPKNLKIPEGMKTESLTLRVGQAALFSPALFHGQEINQGSVTRVSTDLRFVNSNAKIEIKTGKTRAGYVDISHSPVVQTAIDYYHAQPLST